MEVVEQGSVEPVWSGQFECIGNSSRGQNGKNKGCGAVLKVVEEDLVTRHDFGTHFRHDYLAFECPLCGHFTSVNRADVTPKVFKARWNEKKSTFDGEDYSIY